MQHTEAIPWCGLHEPMCVISHWLGASVFAGLAVHLMSHAGPRRSQRIALLVLCITTVQTLAISGVYHLFGPGPLRSFFLQADVAGIFMLIAGSITPAQLIIFQGWWRWTPLVIAWTIAIAGAGLKMTVLPGNPGMEGTLVFIVFGWGAIVMTMKLARERGFAYVRGPILAGLIYTVGATLLILEKPVIVPGVIGPHEVWHLAVLTALGIHWAFVFRIAKEANARLPRRSERPALETDQSGLLSPQFHTA